MRGVKTGDKVDALRKRADEIKAALEAVQAKQKQQEKSDDHQLKALIGAAMVADIDAADNDERVNRKAYVRDVLGRHTVSASARAFLKVKGWL